jgi:serine/threonine-protein kinase
MPLTIGTLLGSHEIVALLGKGGMGEVYRARDLKLKREVAIKILPGEFADDTDRISRFQREAEVLASLNHPNIAAIYDVADANQTRYLVLELVEGETLADRIARGPIPLEEALDIARLICEALEAAHEKSIIHRDLKPANVKLTSEGGVKVLDFGLAKAMGGANAGPIALSNSPTMLNGTMAGMIVGTAAYMSPEQARGREADPRSDVFSFGCVLYEMLTGRQAFQGEDVSDVLASVMKLDPDFGSLPANLNPRLVDLLRRCLARNRKQRWYSIGDVRVELEAIRTSPFQVEEKPASPPTARPVWKYVAWISLSACIVLLAGIFVLWISKSKPAALLRVTRFPLVLGEGQTFTAPGRWMLAISPDGTQIAYVANRKIYLRLLSENDARPIAGTDNTIGVSNPVFSPDGKDIAFWSGVDRSIKKIPVGGGAAITICQAPDEPFGITWSNDDIVFNQSVRGQDIMRVSAKGGKPDRIVSGPETGTNSAQLLPGGEYVMFTLYSKNQVAIQSIKSGMRKTIIETGAGARYVPTGHIIYAVGGNLLAIPFDLKKLDATGGPVAVVEGVQRSGAGAATAPQFSVSDTGTLVYVPGPAAPAVSGGHALALVERDGTAKPLGLPPAQQYAFPRVSRDGKRIAVQTTDDNIISVYDLAGTSAMRPLTLGGANKFPVWSADSERVTFQSDREGDLGIFWQRADGTGPAERLTKAEQGVSHIPDSWTPDGQTLSFTVIKGAGESAVWTYSLKEKKATVFEQVPGKLIHHSMFSPDGRWLAYQSTESSTGRPRIFVQPFPVTGGKYQVSKDGNIFSPLWSADGKELFYTVGSNSIAGSDGPPQLIVTKITTNPTFSFGNPISMPLIGRNLGGPMLPRNYDIMPDGKRFLAMVDTQPEQTAVSQIQVVLNWFRELQERVPVK